MRMMLMAAAALVVCGPAAAQVIGPGAPGLDRTYVSAAEIATILAAAAKPTPGDTRPAPLLASGPFRMNLEYRTAPAPTAFTHANDAELFVVLEGSGEMTTGGTLVGSKPGPSAGSMSGTSIANGVVRVLAKGDMVLVPADTPHQVTQVNGMLALGSLHLPLAK